MHLAANGVPAPLSWAILPCGSLAPACSRSGSRTGLLVIQRPVEDDRGSYDSMNHFRMLLADSGHYVLPLDQKKDTTITPSEKQRVVSLIFSSMSLSTRRSTGRIFVLMFSTASW